MPESHSLFTCPDCHTQLRQTNNMLICLTCNRQYSFLQGITSFGTPSSYWNLIPENEMEKFLEEVQKVGWKHAILESSSQKIRGLYLFTECVSRADATVYLPLNNESVILDIGSGWGSFTFAIAPKVKLVFATDITLQSLRFISARAKQDNISNIQTAHIAALDYGKLPFPDNYFDAVILNGVLEWIGTYMKNEDPLKIQERALREIRRVLKFGGHIFIAIENRLGLKYFFGAPDDHLLHYSPQPPLYTTLVPRFWANLLTKKHLGLPYRNYTHTLSGYRRLIHRTGFTNEEFYYPYPDYRSVSAVIYPLSSKEIRQRVSGEYRTSLAEKKRIPPVLNLFLAVMVRFNLYEWLCNAYVIIARKEK